MLTFVELQMLLEDLGVDPPEFRGNGHVVSDDLTQRLRERVEVHWKEK